MAVDALSKAMTELEEDEVSALVKSRLDGGIAPLEIVNALQAGMVEVGKRFESGEFFLSELVMAGEIMKDAMTILEPQLSGGSSDSKGTVIIGTVKGDIHDLGKDIVVMLLKGSGYNVIDLGVDVPKEKFVEAIKESQAPLVGMSVLLTSCQEAMKDAITAIRAEGLDIKVLIGGNYVDKTVMEHVGADYYGKDASDGLKVAEQIFS
ncbi:MAG: 5-methyltetrahydrofolate--homocysteine methyltransferase [Firmicutes bacterium HGW-Firmicutes-14]|jgi:5-methyltetrahydrofolate--homocysteine methyltransferase|nr:MAG: 5-methyltetrahydrofolate--homocysteine methyltransferase [Firmicutes bacterium HGW-Firmicutes-14]